MSTPPRSLIHFRWLAVGLLGLALQACRTFSGGHASVETPFVLSFDFQEPVQATPLEKERFVRALAYAVPEKSKLLVDGAQVWPPPRGSLKTERVVTSGTAGEVEEFIVKTRGIAAHTEKLISAQKLAGTRMVAHVRDTRVNAVANTRQIGVVRNTRATPMEEAFVARARSTQYVAFKSEADMRDFLRVLSAGRR